MLKVPASRTDYYTWTALTQCQIPTSKKSLNLIHYDIRIDIKVDSMSGFHFFYKKKIMVDNVAPSLQLIFHIEIMSGGYGPIAG